MYVHSGGSQPKLSLLEVGSLFGCALAYISACILGFTVEEGKEFVLFRPFKAPVFY